MHNPAVLLTTDAIRIDVTSTVKADRIEFSDADIVAVSGFCYGDDLDYTFIPIYSIDGFLERCLPRLEDEPDDDYYRRVSADACAKAIMSIWIGGTRSIILIKAGDKETLIDDAVTDDEKWNNIYTRTKKALELASQYPYVGIICSAEAEFDGYIKTTIDTETLEFSHADNRTLSISNWDEIPFTTSEDIIVYKDAVEVNSNLYTVNTYSQTILLNYDDTDLATWTIEYYKLYDFLDLLANICAEAISNGGNIIQSILSSENINVTNIASNEILTRKKEWQNHYCKSGPRAFIPNNDKFRFVSVAVGTATFRLVDGGFIFEYGLGPMVAGLMSSLADDVTLNGRRVSFVRMTSPAPDNYEADTLSLNGFIPVGHTVKTRRGYFDEVVPLSDQNMAIQVSELQHTGTLRLARRLVMKLKHQLESVIGTNGKNIARIVSDLLSQYKSDGMLSDYDFKLSKNPRDPYKVTILLAILPYFTSRIIEVSVIAGPLKV